MKRLVLAQLFLFATYASALTTIASIPGQRGSRIVGQAIGDGLGGSAAAIGDVNQDGRADFALSATGVDRAAVQNVGAVYVIFGSDAPPASIDITTLNGSNGFRISSGSAIANTNLGSFVRGVGDVNGDGVDDLLLGTTLGLSGTGAAYVVFGKPNTQSFAASVDADNLAGAGFKLVAESTGDWFGISTSGGQGGLNNDVNGDGMDDFVIGAQNFSGQTGRAYLIFGRTAWPASVAVGADTQTVKLSSGNTGDQFGSFAVIAPDVNNDSRPEVLVSSFAYDAAGGGNEGAVSVFFGRPASSPWPSTIAASSLNGSNGFRWVGAEVNAGFATPAGSAGDFNGDGIGDLFASTPDGGLSGAARRGLVCVVFGSANWSAEFATSSLDGNNGLCYTGENASDRAGFDASALGDMNGDGLDDLLISANGADVSGVADAGKFYLIYGQSGFPSASINLSGIETTVAGELFTGSLANFRANAVAGIGKFSNADNRPDFVMTAENGTSGDAYLVIRTAAWQGFANGFE
jgi:FG-GAP repeat